MVVGCFVCGAAEVGSRFNRKGSIVLATVVELMGFVECSIIATDGVSEAARVVGLSEGEVSCV